MILWRLSGAIHARAFDGGYGLHFNGRWNTVGHAVTYCASSPALCVLEKLVHVEDPDLLPPLMMVRYEAPDDLRRTKIEIVDLPHDWRQKETWSQEFGNVWCVDGQSALLEVPSVILPIVDSPDFNILINHRHPDVAKISIVSVDPFVFDARFF